MSYEWMEVGVELYFQRKIEAGSLPCETICRHVPLDLFCPRTALESPVHATCRVLGHMQRRLDDGITEAYERLPDSALDHRGGNMINNPGLSLSDGSG